MWNYVVSAHKPTAVTHSVTGNFTSPTDINLIVSKCTRLEIHTLTAEGMLPLLDVPIYGRIVTMELYRPVGEQQDLLFLSTEKYKFCVLGYDAKTGEIVTRANGDIQDRIGRPADIGQIGIIDPDCRVIGLHLYDGLFKVIPMENGQLKEAYNLRLEELQVVDIKFLYGCSKPTIAILYQDNKEKRHVKTYEISLKERDLREGPWSKPHVEDGASMLIPLPRPLGGCLIVGEKSIVYQSASLTKGVHMKPTVIRAYGKIDTDGSRFLLGDDQGNLFVIVLQVEGGKLLDLKLEALGQTSLASTISYLDNGYVFVGSVYGDSQLVKLNAQKDEHGSYIELVDTFTNLGPIVDFCVVDLDRQGQGQIVTCSGAFKDGSLRVIRNGIGINEQAAIDMPGIKGVWSMKPSSNAQFDRYLVVSFIAETRVLSIAGEELEETEISGFNANSQTLFCGNVANDLFVQITPSSVRLVSSSTLSLVNEWLPPSGIKINTASCNNTQIVVATGGGKVIYIEIQDNKLTEVGFTTMEHEVSCVNITPFEGQTRANLCVVGLWTDISLRILSIPDLKEVNKHVLGGEIIPRSVTFASFEGINYLLCGLGDGHLFTFTFDEKSYTFGERKKVSLGTQPILLTPFTSKNATHIFAASDRPTVIYSTNKKLSYSNVNLKEVKYVCPFNTENFADSLTIVTESSLTIGTIDEIQKLHIQTIPLGEMPRRICHQDETQSFIVLTEKATVSDEGESVETDFIRLINDQTFETLYTYPLGLCENVCSVISAKFEDDPEPYYVVGSAFAYPFEPEPTKGRILVLQVKDQKLVLVSEKEVKGAVYSLAPFGTKLLAAINNKIQLYKWTNEEGGESKTLKQESFHHEHVLALFLATRGDFIVVGDLMRSISLLSYDSIQNTIHEIARDYNPNWMTAVEILDDDVYVGAENSFNLFTVKRNSDAATDEERGKLEVAGEYHLGEFVNRFRHGSLVMRNPEGQSVPTLLFGTVNGSVGVLASLNQEQYTFFSKLQNALSQVIKGVGGLRHDQWRSFSSERKTVEAKNFIDGDLIESFLDLKREKMEEVCKLLGDATIEDVSKAIETLSQAIH